MKNIIELEAQRLEWSLKNFPDATPRSSMLKLQSEAKEVLKEISILENFPDGDDGLMDLTAEEVYKKWMEGGTRHDDNYVTYNKDCPDLKTAILSAMEEYAQLQTTSPSFPSDEEKCQELIAFKIWYDKLLPLDKVSVWNDDGTASGIFNMSDKRIVEKYINRK